MQSSLDAVQIFGGYGYMTEQEIERDLRDAVGSTIYSGTNDIQRNIIAAVARPVETRHADDYVSRRCQASRDPRRSPSAFLTPWCCLRCSTLACSKCCPPARRACRRSRSSIGGDEESLRATLDAAVAVKVLSRQDGRYCRQ